MFLYTVKIGDSLYSISRKYDIPVDTIRLVNGLNEPHIVPGQALLMNTRHYTVQPGDSFYTIAPMAFVSPNELMAVNPHIHPNWLQPGMKLLLPNLSNDDVSVLNYFYVTGSYRDPALITDFAPYTTYYSFFEYHFRPDGSLSELNDLAGIEASWLSRNAPLATITNLTVNGFSPELTSQTLNHAEARENLVNNIYHIATTKGYAGVNIDFEGNYASDRDIFSTFLNELGERLHAAGLILTIAVHPKTSDDIPWLQGYDFGAIGSVVDFMFIMAYDWHHLTSGPGPVAPINAVRSAITYALNHMGRKQIILGIPFYGYDWIHSDTDRVNTRAISNHQAIELAARHGSSIYYSEEDQSPYFYYVDEQGQSHVVWFEDSRSVAEKLLLVKEFQLLGVGAWQIGLGFYQGPWLLTNFFNIRKVT